MHGIDLIAELRKQNRAFPILILTARRDWQDKVTGLEAGADDYLTKPFHLEELKARLNALIRRAAGYASPVIEKGPLSLDLGAKEARLYGDALELTAFEYRVLEYLVMNPARVISKAELTEHLYEQDFDRDSNVIEVFIGRLRRKLDPDGTLNPHSYHSRRRLPFLPLALEYDFPISVPARTAWCDTSCALAYRVA